MPAVVLDLELFVSVWMIRKTEDVETIIKDLTFYIESNLYNEVEGLDSLHRRKPGTGYGPKTQ